jgi:hypothetical protein
LSGAATGRYTSSKVSGLLDFLSEPRIVGEQVREK